MRGRGRPRGVEVPNLKRVREEMGMSPVSLARRVGCSASLVYKVEAGTRRVSEDLAGRLIGAVLLRQSEMKRRAA